MQNLGPALIDAGRDCVAFFSWLLIADEIKCLVFFLFSLLSKIQKLSVKLFPSIKSHFIGFSSAFQPIDIILTLKTPLCNISSFSPSLSHSPHLIVISSVSLSKSLTGMLRPKGKLCASPLKTSAVGRRQFPFESYNPALQLSSDSEIRENYMIVREKKLTEKEGVSNFIRFFFSILINNYNIFLFGKLMHQHP